MIGDLEEAPALSAARLAGRPSVFTA